MRGTATHPWLATGAGLVALNALAGAVALATGAMNMGAAVAARFPFHSPAVAGLALAVVVGVPMAYTAVRATIGGTHTAEAAVVAGALLVAWIGVQLIVIRTFTWLQPTMVAAGLAVWAVGWRTFTTRHREVGP